MLQRTADFIARYFLLWTVIGAGLAFLWPELFVWFLRFEGGLLVTVGLALIMLGMGLTLELADFSRLVRYPLLVLGGVALQYTVMPLLGWTAGYLFGLPTTLAVGLVLVACCPGGTASNVIAFLSRANLALSVSMTAVSTLLAALMTPLLTYYLVGNRVDVPVGKLFLDTMLVVVLPVLTGVLANRLLGRYAAAVRPVAPVISVVMIVMIVSAVLGVNRDAIRVGL